MTKKRSKNKIDILLMSDNGLETVGGEQESTKIIINGVKDHYSLGVIQPGNITKPAEGVHYYPLTKETRIKHLVKKPLSFLKYISQVRKVIKREKPKIIHTQAQVSFFIIALLCKFKLVPNTFKLIHTERGLYTKYSNLFKRIFRFFMKELDVLVTTTEFNMKYWKDAIQNWNLSMDFQIIENTAGELFETYDETYKRKDLEQLVLGFAGRYADWKNWPLAVEISELLQEKLEGKLSVNMAVGCLDDNAEKETRKMFEKMSDLLGDQFKGKVNITLEEMDQFYYDLDVFILTSDYNTESFGRTLVEAMSRKTVVLTTDAGGSVEVVGTREKVMDDAKKFADLIFEYYQNPEKMIEEKRSNLKRVKKKYSLKNNIVKHIEMYEEKL